MKILDNPAVSVIKSTHKQGGHKAAAAQDVLIHKWPRYKSRAKNKNKKEKERERERNGKGRKEKKRKRGLKGASQQKEPATFTLIDATYLLRICFSWSV